MLHISRKGLKLKNKDGNFNNDLMLLLLSLLVLDSLFYFIKTFKESEKVQTLQSEPLQKTW